VAKKEANLDARLKRAMKKWDDAKEGIKAGGFDEFDDGRYKAKMVKAEIGVSANDRLQVLMHWKFLSGEYKGKEKIAFQGIETEESLKYFGIDLEKLGYETDSIEGPDDLKGIIKELNKEKPEARISLKTKGEFQNVNIVKVKGSDDDEEAEDEDEDSDDSEDEDEDEEKSSKKKKSKKKKSDDDDDDESEDEDEDEEEDSSKKKKKKKSKDEDEDEDEDESDDDDEDDKKKKKKKKKSDDEDEDEDSDDEDDESEAESVEIAVGAEVTYDYKGKKVKGTVLDVFTKSNELKVQTGDHKRRISIEDVKDVEVPDEPKSKKKKKK